MELVILLALVSGISCRVHATNLKEAQPVKKFNIVSSSKDEDNMMVFLKGNDGSDGQNGTQGDVGSQGPRGPPGLPGLKGTPGVCTKEQCESTELKLLIQRLAVLEKYVKDNQNKTGGQPCVNPTPQVIPSGAKICSTPTTITPTTPPVKPTPNQSPKVSAPPAGAPVNGPVQFPATAAPAPSPAQNQAPPPIVIPAASPVQNLWASPAAATAPVPVGVTVQSTVEAPSTFPGGQVQIEGIVTPQVSVQGFNQPGNSFKKSSIATKGAPKAKRGHKKSSYQHAVHHRKRAHKA